jgi:hypothetical protein
MIRWVLFDRLAKAINIPMITKPTAKVMKCSLENGWKGMEVKRLSFYFFALISAIAGF